MSKSNALRLIAAFAVVAAATLALGGTSSAKPNDDGNGKVYFADLFGGATQHPKKIFFTANSGPRVTKIEWKHWGSKKAVGRGVYEDTQAVPCPPMCHPKSPAKIVLKRPELCKQPKWAKKAGKKLLMYERGTLTHRDTDTGETKVRSKIGSYSSYCSDQG
jgi:hypothetical protein